MREWIEYNLDTMLLIDNDTDIGPKQRLNFEGLLEDTCRKINFTNIRRKHEIE